MATRTPTRTRTRAGIPLRQLPLVALALAAASAPAMAQTAAPERITITARPLAGVAGFGGQTLADSPLQASVVSLSDLADAGGTSLAGLTALDAGLSDAYNAEGYWSSLTVRGFVIDNRSNYRRDGLPINAETALLLANKERIEVLKGTSGIQAGISAPGGLVNLVDQAPQRPTARGPARSAPGRRRGRQRRPGRPLRRQRPLRLAPERRRRGDAAADAQRRRPAPPAGTGRRRPSPGPTRSWRPRSRSAASASPACRASACAATALPDAATIDPRINLNNQPWSLPVVLRRRHRLAALAPAAGRRLAVHRPRRARSSCAATTAWPSPSAATTPAPTSTTPTATARTAASTSTTSAARTNAGASTRWTCSWPAALQHRRRRPRPQRRRAADAQPDALRAPGLQLRRHRPATTAARSRRPTRR